MNLVHEGVLNPNEPDFRDEKREEEEAQEVRLKRETLSVDELADKVREIAAIIHTDEFHEESHDLERLADEIKEAWKREVVSKTETTTVCNAAAIYKALKTIHDKVNILNEECGVDPVEIRDIARAALSAPPRNCDVMSRSICTKHFSTIYEGNRDGLCDVQTEREKNIHLYYIKFNKWLFAPAAERKGEGDGR